MSKTALFVLFLLLVQTGCNVEETVKYGRRKINLATVIAYADSMDLELISVEGHCPSSMNRPPVQLQGDSLADRTYMIELGRKCREADRINLKQKIESSTRKLDSTRALLALYMSEASQEKRRQEYLEMTHRLCPGDISKCCG